MSLAGEFGAPRDREITPTRTPVHPALEESHPGPQPALRRAHSKHTAVQEKECRPPLLPASPSAPLRSRSSRRRWRLSGPGATRFRLHCQCIDLIATGSFVHLCRLALIQRRTALRVDRSKYFTHFCVDLLVSPSYAQRPASCCCLRGARGRSSSDCHARGGARGPAEAADLRDQGF